MRSSGAFHGFQRRVYYDHLIRYYQFNVETVKVDAVAAENLESTFKMIGILYLISALVFLLEYIIHKITIRRR